LIFGGLLFTAAWLIARLLGAPLLVDRPMWFRWYLAACTVNSVVGVAPWLVRRLLARDADELLEDRTERVDLRPTLGRPLDVRHRPTRWAAALPGNQFLSIAVHEKRVRIRRLPRELVGLRIMHLSDLHLTGRLGKPFYERIVELANAAEPDIVALTGDLVEHQRCWDWIPDVFGRLRSKHGAYFVLGNHDIRIDPRETLRRMQESGLTYLGAGGVIERSLRGADMLVAGTDRPWLKFTADATPISPRGERPQLRLLLSHSPDEYAWARRHDFDLMLAGHVHGGQIQIPPIGPILAPSRFGVRYACGTFYEPPTVLHVSRGASSKAPLRYFCPPELTTLILAGPD
jgi:predicted MPP superfamily phosphohydrolase